jgi:hypothetical protein
MHVVLVILCLLAFLVGSLILVSAKSAVREIEGFLLFLISAVLLIGAAIVEAINRQRK